MKHVYTVTILFLLPSRLSFFFFFFACLCCKYLFLMKTIIVKTETVVHGLHLAFFDTSPLSLFFFTPSCLLFYESIIPLLFHSILPSLLQVHYPSSVSLHLAFFITIIPLLFHYDKTAKASEQLHGRCQAAMILLGSSQRVILPELPGQGAAALWGGGDEIKLRSCQPHRVISGQSQR